MRRIGYMIGAACALIALAIGVGRQFDGDGEDVAPAVAVQESGHAAAAGSAGVDATPAPPPPTSSTPDEDATEAPPAAPATGAAPAGEERPSGGAAAPAAPVAPAPSGSAPAAAEESGGEVEAQADAASILRRASAAYEDVRTLSAGFTQRLRNPILRTDVRSQGRLYQRHPDGFLMRFEDPAGDVIVSDGRYFWVYYPSVDSLQVMRAPAGTAGTSGVDLRSQFVGDPLARFEATLDGREAVGGRDAHVLTLTPKQPQGYTRLRIWVDARDHLVRRFEITEENGNIRLFELSDLEINPSLADDLFRFTPPPNARIVDRG